MNAMVPRSCRRRLEGRDFRFITRALTGGVEQRGYLERVMRDEEEALNAVLEDERLLQAVLDLAYPVDISVNLYFYVLVRHSLKEAGIADVFVADYVAATLGEYAKGNAFGMAGSEPAVDFSYHVDFIEALDRANDYDRFLLHVHCGNHFMFLTGLFPRYLARRSERRGAPGTDFYEGVAREAFRTAGEHPLADEFAVRGVYLQLADVFPAARYALNRMAAEYLY
ncbi:MAG: hypothetical protein AAGD22_08975 [Verrucomicrobiota bacterium]